MIAKVDPSHEFFTEAASARGILFPVRYSLDGAQFEALRVAATAVGDTDGFYVHSIERALRLPARPTDPEDWWIALDDYGSYQQAVGHALENLLHSPRGRWAVVILQSDVAVVGGTPEFVDALLASWPSIADEGEIVGPTRQVWAYLRQLARVRSSAKMGDAVPDWLPQFLRHVYDHEETQQLLDYYRQRAAG